MIRRPRPSVRLRLTLTYTALFVVSGTALLGISYLLVQHREGSRATAVHVICGTSVGGGIGVPSGNLLRALPASGPPPLALSKAQCPGVVGGVLVRSFGSGTGGDVAATVGGNTVHAPTPPGLRAEVEKLTAAVSASQAHTLDSFKIESAIALGIITIVSFGLSWWMAGRALAPVHRITRAARTLSERTLHERINLEGPDDELKRLADTFDEMLGRLEGAFDSQRRFIANASHDLRTPLATERVLIDEALANRTAGPDELRMILRELRANSEDTERLIDALLVLARSERGIEQRSQVDLAAVAASVLDQSSVIAAGAGVTVSTALQPATVSGDPGLLERLAGNLVENAIRHNVRGGTVSVSVSAPGPLRAAVLEVDNTGPVLDPASMGRLIEPFRRAGPDRASNDGGVGLGLSIVDAVVTAHHGHLTLTARPEGGLHVRVELPAAEPVCSLVVGDRP